MSADRTKQDLIDLVKSLAFAPTITTAQAGLALRVVDQTTQTETLIRLAAAKRTRTTMTDSR
ncbi:hypothetical protein [Stenomitos frigidus]|uniref:Uncharacterized protein n=1 Tax=Stenomitos frigidus ULC18 TaxID=2107698 RepID=A0A2T1DY18_9CYAN|nr:hypothetical protein [Stenomitos frigidus]PSB25380.1 hypothetical protein C7B82_23920 [Stenomitos frigidus ULC18]